MVLITKKNSGGGGGGGITETSTDTLTNKTIDDYTNFIHADGIHLRVKATENLAYGDVLKFVGFNAGEQAIEVAKRNNLGVPAIGVLHDTLATGEFGMAVSNGLFKNINTSGFSVGTILYPNTSGGFTATNPGGYAQQMAYVVRSHSENGEIMINVGPMYNTSDSMGIQYLWGSVEIPVLEKRSGRVKKDGRIVAYSIDSYDELGDPLVGDFTIFVYINDVFAGASSMSGSSSIYVDDLSTWDIVNMSYNDKITYMSEDNEGCKNIVLTLYYI